MPKKIADLPKPKKKVIAKAYMEEGYSSRQIEEWLGVDNTTIARWAKEATPENLLQFATEFKASLEMVKYKGIADVHNRLLELIPKERRISEIVKAGEFLEGKSNEGVKVQVNNFVPLLNGESAKNVPTNNSNKQDIGVIEED